MVRALLDSLRAWRRTPGVAGIAALSLALGIGATTTFFSIVERLLLRTLDVPEPHQLALLSADVPASASRFAGFGQRETQRSYTPKHRVYRLQVLCLARPVNTESLATKQS